jgi:hypothetical protein
MTLPLKGVGYGGAGMSSQMVRWGGLAGLAAAVVFLVAAIVNLISPYQRGTFDSFSDYLYQLLVTVAFALIAVAIAGLHALQSGRYGRWGTAGASMAFVGYAIIVVVAAATLLAGADVLLSVRFVGAAAILVGSIVLGLMTIRAGILPWWCGVLIIVGFPLGDFSNAVIRGGEGIVLAIVWGLVGWALLSRSGTPEEQPSRAS